MTEEHWKHAVIPALAVKQTHASHTHWMDLHTAGASQQVPTRGGRMVVSLSSTKHTFLGRIFCGMQTEILAFRCVGGGGWWNGEEFSRKTNDMVMKTATAPVFVVSPISYTHPGCYCREWDALQALACSTPLWLHKSTPTEPPTMTLFLISRSVGWVCMRVQFHGHFYFIVHKNEWSWFL